MKPSDTPPEGAAQTPAPEPPPPVGTWRGWYALVAGELALLVVVFWLLSAWASA